jgi:hypothetical protein
LDTLRLNKKVLDKYGAQGWVSSQEAAKELEGLRDETKEANFNQATREAENKAAKGPTSWGRFKSAVAEKAHAVGDWISQTRLAKGASDLNESLKETAGNVGAEKLDNTFGGVSRVQQSKGAATYETPSNLGRGIGEVGYEGARDYALGKVLNVFAGTVIPMNGGKFKMYWNKQEIQAAEFVWKTEGKLWRREAEIWLMKGDKMVKTSRRLDALLFDITTGEVEAAEWSTAKSLSEGAAKKAQLAYQKELFDKAKEGWTVLARPAGEEAFYDITKAAQRTEPYPHWRKP